MTHQSENRKRLEITRTVIQNVADMQSAMRNFSDICVIRLPAAASLPHSPLLLIETWATSIVSLLAKEATLIVIGEQVDLVAAHEALSGRMTYQHWIAIKRRTVCAGETMLPEHHFGATVYTKYKSALRHAKTRLQYTYCPACDKTTKDYGGKKHTYHHYGTLLSDIWRDIACDLDGDIMPILERFADLFGIAPYQELRVLEVEGKERKAPSQPYQELRVLEVEGKERKAPSQPSLPEVTSVLDSQLIEGDCLEILRTLPDNSVDFAFADPPYNLKKHYRGYSDDLAITEYFEWCDRWLAELVRVLKPGRTLAILNIPLWSIRHFTFLAERLQFQNWIAWDALAFPVRLIMPAHYAIVCFSKGEARALPGLVGEAGNVSYGILEPLAEGYCLRDRCVRQRSNDRGPLTDLWWDIHRIKHNSRRVDHPCQLPPQLMYRLISVFTKPDEMVLDCFNGAGTSTLAAHQLGRRYIGIEKSATYHQMALERHAEIEQGLDPFRKAERVLTAKNSPVARVKTKRYQVPKKTLQLEVKRIAQEIGHLPSREELIQHSKYAITYYDEYFMNWSEVYAAARTTGMTEMRMEQEGETVYQPRLL